jgi:hypothetical protein
VVSSSGELWKEHRTFTLSALREFGFGKRSLASRILEEVEEFVIEINAKNGKPFHVNVLLNVSIANIICSINFGQRYDYNDENFQSLLKKISQNTSNENILFLATVLPFIKYIPGDPFGTKRTLCNIDILDEHLRRIIREHEETYDETNLRDFVDVYLKKMRSEKGNPNTTFDGN